MNSQEPKFMGQREGRHEKEVHSDTGLCKKKKRKERKKKNKKIKEKKKHFK